MVHPAKSPESFMFTVGKLDAGMAILLGERAHLIEFPSILLPPGATTGSIVNIAVHRNHAEEKKRDAEFWALQNDILQEFGVRAPEHPKLQLRNVTQTSVTLEWPPIQLATAKLRSLDIYRNGQRLASIPSPTTNTSTKLSGLEINTDYSFQLILRTTAGTFPSNLIRVRTHTMSDTSGISVCFGNVQDPVMLENAKLALREMKAKWSDKIQIDTTHFVCTTPAATPSGAQASGSSSGAPGVEYQRALQLSIPVVQPHWILACHAEKKMVPIASFYLGATPASPINSATFTRPQSMSQAPTPRSTTSPPPNQPRSASNRASMPAPARSTETPPTQVSPFLNQAVSPETKARTVAFEPTPEEPAEDNHAEEVQLERSTSRETKHKNNGSMNREFRFPSPTQSPVQPNIQSKKERRSPPAQLDEPRAAEDGQEQKQPVVTPSSIEVPPPPPVEKERSVSSASVDEGEEEVGDTVDIPLN
ncbi:putative fibronectin type 3 domain containing protein [Lyophyllum shimeji]|uniref:Fibronectin type 3 domain containing protein n=1 Tax=Lyophyllum shimeji TaxID=47721 RepID=A0A9P3UHM6_LYOSH|nr:putative fibronectin type 3 domain containing protein [Lyophyllum shimeji]